MIIKYLFDFTFIKKIFETFLSIFHIFIVNIYILFNKFQNKKIILFYHAKKDLTKIHDFYLTKVAKKRDNYKIIFASKKISTNSFFIKDYLLKYILWVDAFVSNNVSDYFTLNSQKIYLHHDVYDTPLVDKKIENGLKKRLIKYDQILLPSIKSQYIFNRMFEGNINSPKILFLNNYPKLKYLKKNIKYRSSKFKTIIVAPTNFNAFKGYTLLKDIDRLIDRLLQLNYKVIYRPHPSNLNEKKVREINNKFIDNTSFKLDDSNNYINTYKESDIMITDLSGTAYTYAFLTYNPVIFYSPKEKKINYSYYKKLNYFKDRNKVGKVLNTINKIIIFLDKKNIKNMKLNLYKKNIKLIYKKYFSSNTNLFDYIYENSINNKSNRK